MDLFCLGYGFMKLDDYRLVCDTSMTAELALKAVQNDCFNVKNLEGIIFQMI